MTVEDLLNKIIEKQGQIIGPQLARSRAVAAGVIDLPSGPSEHHLTIPEDPSVVVEKLIKSYQEVFGQASVDVCISVIKSFPKGEVEPYIPDSIKQLM